MSKEYQLKKKKIFVPSLQYYQLGQDGWKNR